MSIRVRLPDGSTVKIETDDRQAAVAAANRYWAQKKAKTPKAPPKKKKAESSWLETARNFSNDMLDNIIPNAGDEIAGVGGGLKSLLRGESFSEGYDQNRQRFLRDQARYDRENPNLSWVSTGAGTVAGVALPAGAALRGANLAQKAGQGARVGAAYGAAAGVAEGEGLAERATNAAYGAGMGAATGAALPAGTAAVQSGGNWARRNLPGVDTAYRAATALPRRINSAIRGTPAPSAAAEQANRMLGEQMQVGNISRGNGVPGPAATPQAIAEEVQRRNQMGVPAMIGDVTENMRGMTEYASRGIGPGQALVRRSIEERKAGEAQRVRQHVQDTFPTTADPIQYVEGIQRQAKDAAAPLYREAYGQPMFRTQTIQGIEQTPAFRSAMPQAFTNIRNQIDEATGLPKRPSEMGFREMGDIDPNGLPPNFPVFQTEDGRWIAYDRGLSTEGYDQVVRAMNDSGRAAAELNPVTGAVRNNSNSVHINARASQLRNELMDQNPAYRQAVEGYGDDMTYANAFEQGGDLGKLTGHEVNAQRRQLPDPAHQAWATGAGTAMADAASQYGAKYPNGAVANQVRQMLGDDVKQQAVSEMAGNTGGVRELLDRLEYEHQGHINWQGVNGNSRTAQRQQLDNDLDVSAGIPTSKDGVVSRLVDFVANRAVPQFQQDVKARIAEVVTASDARTVEEAIQAISAQVERDRGFRDLLHKAGIATTAAYGMNVQPVHPTEEQ